MECEFCKKTLSNKSNLTNHQKTNKKCLSAQEKEGHQLNEIKLNACVFCDKIFSEQNLKTHLLCCKKKKIKESEKETEIKIKEIKNESKKEYEIKIKEIENEYKSKIQKLEKEKENEKLKNELEICLLRKELEIKDEIYKDEHKTIKKLALQPKTTTTNIIGNLNLDDTKRIKDILEKEFTPNDILDGQKGLANFAFKNILHDEQGNLVYVCGDSARKIFKYKDSLGKIIKDVNTQKLTDAFIMSDISNITNAKSQEFWINEDGTQDHSKYNIISNPAAEIMNLKYNNVSFREQLVNLTSS